jgi:hypothetical protein
MIAAIRLFWFVGVAAALVAIGHGWFLWRNFVTDVTLPGWRRMASSLGLLGVSAQALVLALIYTGLDNRYPMWFDLWWFWTQLLLFLLAVPCILIGKSPSRWLLSGSSFFLIVFGFLSILDT